VLVHGTGARLTDQQLADAALARILTARPEIATRWLGSPYAGSPVPLMVTVTVQPGAAYGRCWVRDHPRRKYHKVWVYGPADRIWPILRHEVTHCVLAGQPWGRAEHERVARIEEKEIPR